MTDDLPKDDPKKECIDHVLDCQEESLDFYQDKFREFDDNDKLYFEGAKERNTPMGRSNLMIPTAMQQIEPYTSQMSELMFGEAPYIKYSGAEESDEETADKITEFTQKQLDSSGFFLSGSMFVRDQGIHGIAIMKVIPSDETMEYEETTTQTKPVLNENGEAIGEEEVEITTEEEDVIFSGYEFINIDVRHFFVPKSANTFNIQKLPWVIHQTFRSEDYVLDNPTYDPSEVKRFKEFCKYGDRESLRVYSKKNTTGKLSDAEKKKYSEEVTILEYWGLYDNEKYTSGGDQPRKKKYLIVVGIYDGEYFLFRKEPFPFKYKFKPFIACPLYPKKGEFYGYGHLKHLKGLIKESHALRNSRLDIVNQSLFPAWLAERSSGFNFRELINVPNKIHFGNDINGIRRLDPPQATPASYQELGQIDFDIQNTTEIMNPRQDVSRMGTAFSNTATGVGFLNARSSSRFLFFARILLWGFMKPLAQMLLWHNKGLITDEIFYRSTDDRENPYSSIGPDAFATQVDFIPNSAPDKLSLQQQRGNFEYFMQTLAQYLKVRPQAQIDDSFILKEGLKVAGFSHPERAVKRGPTLVMQTPDGQLVDQQGQPVQVIPAQPPEGVPNG